MLPYNRELSRPLYATQEIDQAMVTTPYKVNALLSSTDSVSNYGLDTNNVDSWYRYVAYTSTRDPNYLELFTKVSVDWISLQITLRLQGVHPEGKKIVVPDETILTVLDSFFNKLNLKPEQIREQVVMYIVEQVKNDFQITEQNDKLSAWVMKYDVTTGLRRYSDIKLNEKRGTHFYSWNY